jgi:RNA polymerase sigma factor (sigma-70 family)
MKIKQTDKGVIMETVIKIDEKMVNRIKKLAYKVGQKYNMLADVDDLFGAGLDSLASKPQPTIQRTIGCAYYAMIDEIRKILGNHKYETICVDDFSFFDEILDSRDIETIVEKKMLLEQWFAALTTTSKKRLNLYIEGYTMNEIAKMEGVSEARICTLINEITATWKKNLQERG